MGGEWQLKTSGSQGGPKSQSSSDGDECFFLSFLAVGKSCSSGVQGGQAVLGQGI